MDYLKLAQRTISMLDSMIKSGECHTTRTKEMVNNAQNGLEKLRQYNVIGQSKQLHLCPVCKEKAGKSYLLSKLPTICQKCDHAWNRA